MKSKKFVSLLLAACLSLSAMTVNAWAENGGENKEVPAPVVQEVEGEDKKDQETKPEEPKTEETGEGENKETNKDETKETDKDETKETDKDENKAGEGEDKKNEETKPADPSAAVAYGTAAVAMALNNGNSNPPGDNEPFSESTVTVVKRVVTEGLTKEELKDLVVELKRTLEINVKGIDDPFRPAQLPDENETETNNGVTWKWEPQSFDGTVTDNDVTETGSEVDGYNLSMLGIDVKKESTSTTVTVTNYYTKKQTAGNFTIVKVDKDDTTKKLEGATFTLTAVVEDGQPANEPAYEKTTDANGEAKFENVPLGKYILKETVAPQGYQLPVDVTYEVVVNESTLYIEGDELISEGTNFYIPNTQLPTSTTGSFTITKVDADNHDLKLTGAQFTLKKDGYVQTRTSDQGIAAFYDVPVGTYTLTETVAPQGYVKPNEIYTVKVNENGKISVWKVTAPSGGDFTVTLPDDFIIQNPDGNVEVKDKNFVVENTKEAPGTTSYTFMKHGVVTTVDSNGRTIRTTESPLAGAEFTLYDAEENMLQTVRSAVDGSVTFSNLIDGGYYIIKETKAPSGYTGWNGRIKLSVHFDEQGKPEIRVLVEYLSEDREENITGELTVRNYTTVKETEHPVDDRPTYRYDDDDDYVLPTVTRKDNKKPANKPERAPRVEEVIPSKRNPETGNSSSMPIAMAAAAVSLTGLVVLCKKKDK